MIALTDMVDNTVEDSVTAIAIICEGQTFIAGADITELSSAPRDPDLHKVLYAPDNSAKPTIAWSSATFRTRKSWIDSCCP